VALSRGFSSAGQEFGYEGSRKQTFKSRLPGPLTVALELHEAEVPEIWAACSPPNTLHIFSSTTFLTVDSRATATAGLLPVSRLPKHHLAASSAISRTGCFPP